ncbi:hypothetical protein LT679_15890 [Mucilaginibacter roseus]|uniref:Uncharacterized protein n=1 Tax=Mucilaginibacter roseus TaxID=1528868 RepID=A0ABS8U4Q3_9SPHI|nr:hypothetical protein [Mucilaginibacter roseus]MCD8742093.1 hypothetical protein [Mucilaginibacter roseus]
MKKIILSAMFALATVAFMPSSSKAQTKPTAQSGTNRAMIAPEPTNALAAWSMAYQYAMTHGWGQEDSLWWANAQMKIWISKHS